MENKIDILRKGFQSYNISLTDKQIEQFDQYYNILIEWNGFMNLTGITQYEEVVTKHFIDSISLVNTVDIKEGLKIIDIGTGAGFPGIPIKIIFPKIEIVLLDSLNKRIRFLNEVINQLGLQSITAVHGRAEDYAQKNQHREQYDLCVSRAVANLSSLSEYCIPFTKVDGYFISYKSGEIEEELKLSENAIKKLGGKIEKVEKFNLPDSDISRSLIVIKKIKNTMKKFPRKSGLPTKEPLN